MPHATDSVFQYVSCTRLHPTFGAEISGVDFTKSVPLEVFDEIRQTYDRYAVLVFRDTGLTDRGHVGFAALFGDLDDASPCVPPGQKHRFDHIKLFDVGNVEEHGWSSSGP